MPVDPSTTFSPPSPRQFESYLGQHPVRPPSRWVLQAPMLVAVGLLGVSLVTADPLRSLLPWVAIAWLFGHTAVRTRRTLDLESKARRVQEVAMLRRYPEALRRAWRLLPQATPVPFLHGQTIAMIAHCLDTLGSYDAAIVGYDYLLKRLPPGQPITVHIGVSRAAAALGAQNLSDADDALRRLRGAVEPFPNSPISAAYRLAQLAQHVRTNHFQDGVSQSEGLVEALRPLGVEAGYGHALMALCLYHQPDSDDRPGHGRKAAQHWWRQATLLLPPATLIQRFPELAPLTELS
jgi:tetratricopeptide (TPR) repeat protein